MQKKLLKLCLHHFEQLIKCALALENWYDLLAFLSRLQLGQLGSCIGNRRFASIVQCFLHNYIRQITLRPINLSQTANEDENDHSSKARVNLWQKDGWGSEEFPVADWPMPENITNFQSIQLSYLDLSVLRFLQQFHQNSLFTNVNLHFPTMCHKNDNAALIVIVQCLSHILPLIASIDSIVFRDTDLLNLNNKGVLLSLTYRVRPYPKNAIGEQQKAELSQLVTRMIDRTRILVLTLTYPQIDWLCNWLYTPRDDHRARVLLLLGHFAGYISFTKWLSEWLKNDFSVAKEAVSYFVGIQTGYWDEAVPIISSVPLEILTNSQTNERMTIQLAYEPPMQTRDNEPTLMLISRYPLDAAKEWIDASEKEILEWNTRKRSRKIEFDGENCAIGPMEPPNLFQKLLSIFH